MEMEKALTQKMVYTEPSLNETS